MNWKPIPGWPRYEASTDGQIRIQAIGRVLSQQLRIGDDYLVVDLYGEPGPGSNRPNRRIRKTIGVNILVCMAFHGPRPSARHEAAHCNGKRKTIQAAISGGRRGSRTSGIRGVMVPPRRESATAAQSYCETKPLQSSTTPESPPSSPRNMGSAAGLSPKSREVIGGRTSSRSKWRQRHDHDPGNRVGVAISAGRQVRQGHAARRRSRPPRRRP